LGGRCRAAAAIVANPYAEETNCSVDCWISTTRAGAAFSLSCTKKAAGGGAETVLCARPFDRGTLVQDEILKHMQRGEPMQNWMKKK
jgi:hypothetical protein